MGALTRPPFSQGVSVEHRSRIRRDLGVHDAEPVALISAGSLGLGSVTATVRAVLGHPRVRVVVLCGRNASLRRALSGLDRVKALGWRDDVPELMSAADVLIHNAGGLSFTEALVAGLPAITYQPIPGHGRANARVLAAAELAAWPRNPDDLAAAIDEVLRRPRRGSHTPVPQTGRDAAAVLVELLGLDPSVAARRQAG